MRISGVIFSSALLLGACSNGTGLSPYHLPPPDTSIDPARISPGQVLYACGAWKLPPPTPTSELTVDVYLRRFKPSEPQNFTTMADRSRIERLGGQVLYAFHMTVLRARLTADVIPTLARGDSAVILTVPNEARFDWLVGVFYDQSGLPDSARAADFASLGGRIDGMYPAINSLLGYLPDRSVAALRAAPHVSSATGLAGYCALGGSRNSLPFSIQTPATR